MTVMNIPRVLEDNLMDTIRDLRVQLVAQTKQVADTAGKLKNLELIALANGMDPYAAVPVALTHNPES
jgi:hypothetical protein